MTTSELSASGETYGLRAILENCSDGDRNEAIVADISSDPDEVRERAKQYLQAGVTPSTLPDVVLDTLGR